MNKANVAILTTVANFDLYNITSKLFPATLRKYVIDGTEGMHGIHSLYYMFEKLKHEDIDWLIMADEDVIFKNSDSVFSIIEHMEKEGTTVAGVRDGGVIKHRVNNPHMINTFFSILNFKDVLSIWNKREVKRNQYIASNEFAEETLSLKSEYDINNLYEPYYCFYLWLKRKGKTFLYLEASMLEDNISNTVLFNDKVLLYHTWYARSYGVNEKHTNRINEILISLNVEIENVGPSKNAIVYKDHNFAKRQKTKKIIKRIVKKFSK